MLSQTPILVTGISGYIASWIVKLLLEEGLTVHGTVRDITKTEKYQHLLDIEKASNGTLKVFEADLLDKGSFEKGMINCEIVIHTASPFIATNVKDGENILVKPALEGTRNVLNTANQINSVKRVVLTSSVVATLGDSIDAIGKKITEADWNTSSTVKHRAYAYSKTVAEKEAWKIAKSQNQWDLVVINPGFVMRPSLTKRKDSTSIGFMRSLAKGTYKMGVPELYFGLVDVRDVAKAHLQAAFTPEAQGRHITSNETVGFLDFANFIRAEFGSKYPLPKSYLPKAMLYLFGPLQGITWKFIKNNIGFAPIFDNTKSKEQLNIKYRPVEKTITDHFQQLLNDGLIK